MLANAQAYWDARELSEGPRRGDEEPLHHRAGQGHRSWAPKGVDEDEAFQILVRASQRENVKLRVIAQRIINDAVARARVQGDGERPAREP